MVPFARSGRRASLVAGFAAPLLLALGCGGGGPGGHGSTMTRNTGRPDRAESLAGRDRAAAATGPYAVRFVRSCLQWSATELLGSDRHIFGCNGAVFDGASGELLEVRDDDPSIGLAAVGERSLWRRSDDDDVAILSAGLAQEITVHADVHFADAVPSPDGRRVALASDDGLYLLELEGRSLRPHPGAGACATNLGYGFSPDGRLQCAIGEDGAFSLLTFDGRGGEVRSPLPDLLFARWTRNGAHIVGVGESAVHWLDSSGRVVTSEPHAAGVELLASDADSVVVAEDGRTELWSLRSGQAEVEVLYDRRAEAAAVSGDQIVLSVVPNTLVWLRRTEGAAATPSPAANAATASLPIPDPPAGFTALEAGSDGTESVFRGSQVLFNRAPHEIAAFVRDGRGFAIVRVMRSDADEMAHFASNDAAWAAAVATRYVEAGAQRWAKFFRDEEGSRVLRGHAYIGGCERTHFDVLVRERGQILERWVVATNDGRSMDAILGPIPGEARAVQRARSDEYRGDPSVGPVP